MPPRLLDAPPLQNFNLVVRLQALSDLPDQEVGAIGMVLQRAQAQGATTYVLVEALGDREVYLAGRFLSISLRQRPSMGQPKIYFLPSTLTRVKRTWSSQAQPPTYGILDGPGALRDRQGRPYALPAEVVGELMRGLNTMALTNTCVQRTNWVYLDTDAGAVSSASAYGYLGRNLMDLTQPLPASNFLGYLRDNRNNYLKLPLMPAYSDTGSYLMRLSGAANIR